MKASRGLMLPAVLIACSYTTVAHASLTVFQQYTGNVAYSSDGFGSTSNSGTISASVPSGSTVLAAYLYTSTFFNQALSGVGGTFEGNAISYSSLGVNASSCCSLTAARANVTSIVKPVIDGGPGGVYNFSVTETSSSQDGEALVVIYNNPSLPQATVGVLDGFSTVTGDSASISYAAPLDPTAPGFFAELTLGIGFSCCDQRSTVEVNGTVITINAGNYDDGDQAANGSLITVGGYDDPYSPLNPSYADDHEKYNLVPYINAGDTSIVFETLNPSTDDNIFLAIVHTAGIGQVVTVPEPGAVLFIITGLILIGVYRRTSLSVAS